MGERIKSNVCCCFIEFPDQKSLTMNPLFTHSGRWLGKWCHFNSPRFGKSTERQRCAACVGRAVTGFIMRARWKRKKKRNVHIQTDRDREITRRSARETGRERHRGRKRESGGKRQQERGRDRKRDGKKGGRAKEKETAVGVVSPSPRLQRAVRCWSLSRGGCSACRPG